MKATSLRSTAARKSSRPSKAALGRYLAAGLGATGLSTIECEAAIVSIDIAAVGTPAQDLRGINAGITNGTKAVAGFPTIALGPNNLFTVYNYNRYGEQMRGFLTSSNLRFAVSGSVASPLRIGYSGTIGSTLSWNNGDSLFQYGSSKAPSWGADSYLGFRVYETGTSFLYGYFKATWDSAGEKFEILSGAYESAPNVPIITPVPEPAGVFFTGIGALALGAGAIRRSRKVRKAAAKGVLAEAV